MHLAEYDELYEFLVGALRRVAELQAFLRGGIERLEEQGQELLDEEERNQAKARSYRRARTALPKKRDWEGKTRLECERKRHGMSQEGLASRVGVTRGVISGLECGRNNRASREVRRDIAAIFDLEEDELLEIMPKRAA